MNALRVYAHLKVANAYAELSYAERLKVGAVLIKEDRPISVGYNGMPTGADNKCEFEIDGELLTNPEVIHAEMNCIAFAAKNGVSTNGCSMIITHSPCYDCAKLIKQSGIKEVFYHKEYRDISSIKFLRDNGVKVESI
jgi:dCMP deaminase